LRPDFPEKYFVFVRASIIMRGFFCSGLSGLVGVRYDCARRRMNV